MVLKKAESGPGSTAPQENGKERKCDVSNYRLRYVNVHTETSCYSELLLFAISKINAFTLNRLSRYIGWFVQANQMSQLILLLLRRQHLPSLWLQQCVWWCIVNRQTLIMARNLLLWLVVKGKAVGSITTRIRDYWWTTTKHKECCQSFMYQNNQTSTITCAICFTSYPHTIDTTAIIVSIAIITIHRTVVALVVMYSQPTDFHDLE